MQVFPDEPDVRFAKHCKRVGAVIGGGSDSILLRSLLTHYVYVCYYPQMGALHAFEPWRVQRHYFLSLQCCAEFRYGRFLLPTTQTKSWTARFSWGSIPKTLVVPACPFPPDPPRGGGGMFCGKP